MSKAVLPSRIGVQITGELWQELFGIRLDHDITMSEFVRQCIERVLADKGLFDEVVEMAWLAHSHSGAQNCEHADGVECECVCHNRWHSIS